MEKSKNVFYLDPSYKGFIPHKTRLKRSSLANNISGMLIAVTILVSIAFLISLYMLSPQVEDRLYFGENMISNFFLWLSTFTCFSMPLLLLFGVPIAWVMTNRLWTERKFRLLRTQGVLLNGQLVSMSDSDYDKNCDLVLSPTTVIIYQFTTPDGRTLTRSQKYVRMNRLLRPRPANRANVMVLYANDSAVMML